MSNLHNRTQTVIHPCHNHHCNIPFPLFKFPKTTPSPDGIVVSEDRKKTFLLAAANVLILIASAGVALWFEFSSWIVLALWSAFTIVLIVFTLPPKPWLRYRLLVTPEHCQVQCSPIVFGSPHIALQIEHPTFAVGRTDNHLAVLVARGTMASIVISYESWDEPQNLMKVLWNISSVVGDQNCRSEYRVIFGTQHVDVVLVPGIRRRVIRATHGRRLILMDPIVPRFRTVLLVATSGAFLIMFLWCFQLLTATIAGILIVVEGIIVAVASDRIVIDPSEKSITHSFCCIALEKAAYEDVTCIVVCPYSDDGHKLNQVYLKLLDGRIFVISTGDSTPAAFAMATCLHSHFQYPIVSSVTRLGEWCGARLVEV